jgi:hypothetical protein
MRLILLETETMIRLQNNMITIDINNLINRYSMDKDDLKTKILKLNKVDDNDSSVDEREKLKANAIRNITFWVNKAKEKQRMIQIDGEGPVKPDPVIVNPNYIQAISFSFKDGKDMLVLSFVSGMIISLDLKKVVTLSLTDIII